MIFNTGVKQYTVIRDVLEGKSNNVYVCKRLDSPTIEYKTVWLIKDKSLQKQLVKMFHDTNTETYESCFMCGEELCMIFPYVEEREVSDFYLSTINDEMSREKICLEYVTKCMVTRIPNPIVELILKQSQVQLMQDGSIYFNFFLDLSQMNAEATLQDCIILCAKNILALLGKEELKNNFGYSLIQKKLDRKGYVEYIQLFADIKLLSKKTEKRSLWKRTTDFLETKRDVIFTIFKILSIILLILVLFMLILRGFIKDFYLSDLFKAPVTQIGTESLLQ